MTGIGTGYSCNGGGTTMINCTAQRQQLRVQPVPQSAFDMIAKTYPAGVLKDSTHINL